MKSLLVLLLGLLVVVAASDTDSESSESNSAETDSSSSSSDSSSQSEKSQESDSDGDEEGSWLNSYCSCSSRWGWCASSRRWRMCDALFKPKMAEAKKRADRICKKYNSSMPFFTYKLCSYYIEEEKTRCENRRDVERQLGAAEKRFKFDCWNMAGIMGDYPQYERTAKARCRRYGKPVSYCIRCKDSYYDYQQLLNKANWAGWACDTVEKEKKICQEAERFASGQYYSWKGCKEGSIQCKYKCKEFCDEDLHETTFAG